MITRFCDQNWTHGTASTYRKICAARGGNGARIDLSNRFLHRSLNNAVGIIAVLTTKWSKMRYAFKTAFTLYCGRNLHQVHSYRRFT